jgi:hypothetical protein
VREPVAVGDLGDLQTARSKVAEFHALDPTVAVVAFDSPRKGA